jgi:prepilin signal peptidase PulO-like enzyme (type II secretory pathway)
MFILMGAYGACIGSFLNVVIYRLPEGRSLVRPGSRCPKCGHDVAWYDNVPILSWFVLGGRCRQCRASISIQYPIVEAATALLFVGEYWLYYMSGVRSDFVDARSFAPLPLYVSLMATWPALLIHSCLLAGLLAASIIDARYYIIPLPITWTLALIAAVGYPLGTMMQVIPTTGGLHIGAQVFDIAPVAYGYYAPPWGHPVLNIPGLVVGALLGLLAANVLLWVGVIPRSFEDEESAPAGPGVQTAAPGPAGVEGQIADQSASASTGHDLEGAETPVSGASPVLPQGPGSCEAINEPLPQGCGSSEAAPAAAEAATASGPVAANVGTPEQWMAYPHPRREVLIELLFLGWPVLGALLGNVLMPMWNFQPTEGQVPFVQALFVLVGVGAGYLVGGAAVWVTRILGTLAFGKEAMGLGDVHLMAAIGAVLGWRAALITFFIAPFFGMAGTLMILLLRRVGRRQGRVVPYGPYLAMATAATLMLHDRVLEFLGLRS